MTKSIVCVHGINGKSNCKECWRAYVNDWKRKQGRDSGYKTRRRLASYRFHIKYTYGLSWDEYLSLLEKSNGRCDLCGEQARLCIDHDHNTGKVRGLLCWGCNTALGRFEGKLHQALSYLSRTLD